jgi:hypothetical protein
MWDIIYKSSMLFIQDGKMDYPNLCLEISHRLIVQQLFQNDDCKLFIFIIYSKNLLIY